MNDIEVQRSRYILRTRFRRAQTSPIELFSSSCMQLKNWLYNYPIISEICLYLDKEYVDISKKIERIINDTSDNIGSYSPEIIKLTDIESHAALSLFIVKAIAKIHNNNMKNQKFQFLCLTESLTGEEYNYNELEDATELLKDIAIDSLFEYLDERIDDRNAIYGIINKYKQISEWFNKEELLNLATVGKNNRKGELGLVIDLHKFIMEQAVEFVIEPSSASGEVDLILRDPNGTYLIIDAKYLDDSLNVSKIKNKISRGFHQVMKYCNDYNETNGFLVVYNNTNKRIVLDFDKTDGIPFIKIGGKNIFYITVDLKIEPKASKLGIADELYINTEEVKNIN